MNRAQRESIRFCPGCQGNQLKHHGDSIFTCFDCDMSFAVGKPTIKQIERAGYSMRDGAEQQKVQRKKSPRMFSLGPAFSILDCEGFTPYFANLIRRWWIRKISDKEREQLAIMRTQFKAVTEKLTEEEKKYVGQFINWQHEMGYKAGIRSGMACVISEEATRNGHE